MSLSAQSRAVRGSTLAAVGFPPAAFHFHPPRFHFTSSNGDTAGLPTRIRLMRRTAIGAPSDWYCSSYFLPFLSTAVQVMLESSSVTKLPTCLQRPAVDSTDGTGRPSAFGLSLDFSSIRSIGNSYRLASGLRPLSPENVMMWLS